MNAILDHPSNSNLRLSSFTRRSQPKINYVDSEGNPTEIKLGSLFDRTEEQRADIELRRPGTFHVSKVALLAAIVRRDTNRNDNS